MERYKVAELVGGGFSNKGAELMVEACCQEIDTWENCQLAMDWTVGSVHDRGQRKLLNKVDFKSLKSLGHVPAALLPDKIKNRLGIVSRNDVNAVIDISGFGYSDQWGTEYAKIMEQRSAVRHSKGEQYYLLPQAYGPFEDSKVADVVKSYFDKAEVLYVRDKASMIYMEKLMGNDERLKLSPDFSCLVSPALNVRPTNRDYACIVPNCRMLDPRHGKFGDDYISGLVKAVDMIGSKGLLPVLVNHEGAEDLKIVKELQKQVKCETLIVAGGSAKYLKGVFTEAKFVIASRYHALISAMTQSIPAIGTGWSHKYEELFSDFENKEYLVSVKPDGKELIDSIDSLLDEGNHKLVTNNLYNGASKYKDKSRKMWDEVRDLFGS